MALAIYKRGPKCYNFLRKLLAFPSTRTLNALLRNVPFAVGINEHIFHQLGETLKKYPEKERVCTLAFDEMALRKHVQYNAHSDCIEGLEDYGSCRTGEFAKFALVFMVQGIVHPFKQPVSFYFSSATGATRLQSLLKEVLTACFANGIPILATVCDMGTSNVSMLKRMGCTEDNPSFLYQGHQIFSIFDVPHLLKCTRNLFQKYHVLIPASDMFNPKDDTPLEARWSDIVTAYKLDKGDYPGKHFCLNFFLLENFPNTSLFLGHSSDFYLRQMTKIQDYYLAPLRQTSMKVKVAARTLSRSTAISIKMAMDQGESLYNQY